MNSHEVFIHIYQGCFAGTGAIVRLPQCQWSKPDGYGKISQCITTTKHSKAKTVCIFLEIYCTSELSTIHWLLRGGFYKRFGATHHSQVPWLIWIVRTPLSLYVLSFQCHEGKQWVIIWATINSQAAVLEDPGLVKYYTGRPILRSRIISKARDKRSESSRSEIWQASRQHSNQYKTFNAQYSRF